MQIKNKHLFRCVFGRLLPNCFKLNLGKNSIKLTSINAEVFDCQLKLVFRLSSLKRRREVSFLFCFYQFGDFRREKIYSSFCCVLVRRKSSFTSQMLDTKLKKVPKNALFQNFACGPEIRKLLKIRPHPWL